MKPLITALARLIRNVQEAIDDQNSAEHDARRAATKEADAPHTVVVSTSADKKFVAEVHPYDPQGQTTQNSIKNATWFAGWSALLAFIAAAIYSGIAACTLAKINEQNTLLRTAGEREQRAYVSVPRLQVHQSSASHPFWAITPVFANTGSTPTKNLRWTMTAHDWDPFLPFSKVVRGGPSGEPEDITQATLNPLSLGPHQEVSDRFEGSEAIPTDDVILIRQGKLSVYVHGVLVYDDFVSDKHHVVRYCYRLWSGPIVTNEMGFAVENCGGGTKWNCTDEECDAQTQTQLKKLYAAKPK